MPARWLLPALVALALPGAAQAQTTPPEPTPQALFGGLIVSQMLTLYTTPVIYLYLDRFSLWCRSRWSRGSDAIRA